MKMEKKIINILILLIINYYISLTFNNVKAKEITIKNDENFHNLNNILRENINEDDHLILNFVDSYYNMELLNDYGIDITVLSNISFIGNKNGTIFDYRNNYKGAFKIILNKESIIKVENIIFENFNTQGFVHAMKLDIFFPNFKIIISQCTFRYNHHAFFAINFEYPQLFHSENNINFNDCNF